AGAFGATMALQGPLSNYGAGLSIILARPFVVGNTITVGETSGVVDEVKMAHTRLLGEDGERITIPNKDIVGRVIVNSETRRVVQTKIALAADADLERAAQAVQKAVASALPPAEEDAGGARPQVGLHDFTFGGLILGVRFWVPSSRYYELRYAVNRAILDALRGAGVPMLAGVQPAVLADVLSGDGVQEGRREDG
ncbi:MAG: mechanosensitive ion channel family protein, partial [Rhodospirillales bacterium]